MAKKSPLKPFHITPVHERLLIGSKERPFGGIYHLHMLRAEQFCRLEYSPKSVKYVQAVLKDLVDNHYLQEEWPPTRLLRSKYIYVLGKEGIAYLKENDYDVSSSLRSSKEIGRGHSHITHLLELNDVLISAMLLQQKAPLYYLAGFTHDRELKRHPCRVIWRGKKLEIIPDAFLDFHVVKNNGGKLRMPIMLEHDCNSEFGEGFRKKIRALIMLIKSEAYKEHFKVNSITIAFTTFGGEKRRDTMREVVSQELVATNEPKSIGYAFLFTNIDQSSLIEPDGPHKLWLEPCWYTLGSNQPVSLLTESD